MTAIIAQNIKLCTLILLLSITACMGRNSNNYNSKFGDINKDSILSLQNEIKYSETPLLKITIPAHSKLSKSPNQIWKDFLVVIDTIIVTPLDSKSKEGLIGTVDKIVIKDSILYVLDRDNTKRLYVFNQNTGGFIRKIGDVGRAENEYTLPHDFFIINDSLMGIYDHFGRKILYYNEKGDYLRTTRLKHIAMNMVNNDGDTTLWCIGHGNYHLTEVNKFDLINIGINGKIYNGVAHGKRYLNYNSYDNLKPYKNGIVYNHPFSNTLLHIKDSTYYPLVEIKFEEKGLPDNFIEECNGDMENFFRLYQKTHSYVDNFILTDEYVLITYTAEPRFPYLLLYSLKEKRIIAQGIKGADGGAGIKLNLENYILSNMKNMVGYGNMLYGFINHSDINYIDDEEGFKRYNLDKEEIKDFNSNYLLVKLKLK